MLGTCPLQAVSQYESSLSDQRTRATALADMTATLHACHVFGADNRACLAEAVATACNMLVHRRDQVRALCTCSRMHWQASGQAPAVGSVAGAAWPPVQDADKVRCGLPGWGTSRRLLAQHARGHARMAQHGGTLLVCWVWGRG